MITSDLKIFPIKSYNRQQAIDSIKTFKADLVPGSNCTLAWIAAGKPLYGTKEFNQFCIDQLIKKTKCSPGLGCYIVLEEAKEDSRSRPFYLYNYIKQKGARKYILKHLISEVKLSPNPNKKNIPEIISIGNPIIFVNTLREAKEAVKDLTIETKKDYIIQCIKIPNDSIETISIYSPSIRAKEGTYIMFGYNI